MKALVVLDQESVRWLHMRLGAHAIHFQSWYTIQKTNSQILPCLQLHFIVLIWWSLWVTCLTDSDWQMALTAVTKGNRWAVISNVRPDVCLFLTCSGTRTYLNRIINNFSFWHSIMASCVNSTNRPSNSSGLHFISVCQCLLYLYSTIYYQYISLNIFHSCLITEMAIRMKS